MGLLTLAASCCNVSFQPERSWLVVWPPATEEKQECDMP